MSTAVAGGLAIREAAPVDRPAMLDLWVEAWAAVRPEIDFKGRRPWLDRHLDAWRDRGACIFVGVLDGDCVAAFATLDPATSEVDQLVTAVWAQRRGVGQAMLRHAKQLSPRGLVLSVNQFNIPAIRAYEGEGFYKTGEGVSPLAGLPTWHMRWAGIGNGVPGSRR